MKKESQKAVEMLVYDEEYMTPLLSQIMELCFTDKSPNLDILNTFYVYSGLTLKKTKRPRRIQKLITGQSESCPCIVLVSGDRSVLLQISDITWYDDRRRLYLDVRPFLGSLANFEYHGHVIEQGKQLIYLAVKLLDRLSFLFRYPSMCHLFIPKYLTLIGVGDYRYFNDCERILMIAGGKSAAEILEKLYDKQIKSNSVFV